jgi:tetratricopeptide (TPR) repeat protein
VARRIVYHELCEDAPMVGADDPTVPIGPRRDPASEADTLVGPPTMPGALPALVEVDPSYYAIGAELARGGMGQIHVAHDRRLGRDVALKELLPESDNLAARFEREARITAQLQHPSIVSVHEAGRWPDGRPFYAMELVSGQSLDQVLRRTKTLAERMSLVPTLLAVADAIAYAHSRRIIHRDLKPGNVIVGEFGETIVIDWGLAKYVGATDPPPDPISEPPPADSGEQTAVGAVMGTPGYMSPEQAAGELVDERTDVYAIGAIAFHALTGARARGGPARLADREPAVPPDLAAIVDRAMAPEREARYPTARELAEDLRRFQTGQLVGAHRYSFRELVRRWLRRYRTAVTVAAIAAVALIAVSAFAVRSVLRARARADEQRALAVQRGADAEDVMGFMLFDLGDKLRRSGRLELMDAMTRRAIAYYDARAAASDTDPTRLATALEMVGDVLRDEGDLVGARSEYRRALAIASGHEASAEPIWLHHVAVARNSLGDVAHTQGDLPRALEETDRARAIAEVLVRREPGDPRWQRDLATSLSLTATILTDRGDHAQALDYYKRSLALREQLAASQPDGDTTRRDLMIGHEELGMGLDLVRDADGAQRELDASLAIAEREAERGPTAATWQRDVATAHERLGDVARERGEVARALSEYRREIDVMMRLVAIDPTNADWQRRLSVGRERAGSMLLQQGDAEAALVELRACKEIRMVLTARDSTNTRWQRDLSVVTNRIGDALLARSDVAGALEAFRTAKEIRDRLAAKDPTNAKWQGDLLASHRRIGSALLRGGDASGAMVELDAALAVSRQVFERDRATADENELLLLHQDAAAALKALGDRARAHDELAAALAVARHRAERDPDRAALKADVERLTAALGTP